jgi:hypothetical protein
MNSASLNDQKIIPQESVLAILNRWDDTREFMIQMWLNNPQLAKQGGKKVADLLQPLLPTSMSSRVPLRESARSGSLGDSLAVL